VVVNIYVIMYLHVLDL